MSGTKPTERTDGGADKWKRLVRVGVAVPVLTLAIGTAPAGAQASVEVVRSVVPYSAQVWVPCANNGSGEVVSLTGFQLVVRRTVSDAGGGSHTSFHAQPMGVSGVGQATGDLYRAAGGAERVSNLAGVGASTFIGVSTFAVIGLGRAVNFVTHQVVHFTVLDDGTPVVQFDRAWTECR